MIISVWYLIVYVNLIYLYEQAETFAMIKTWNMLYREQILLYKSITAENQHVILANIISPYWNMTYNEQLDMKQNRCHAIVDTLEKRCESYNIPKTCKLLQIVPSPVTKAYRSKDEFTIWKGFDGNPKTVGIRIGKPTMGGAICVLPTKVDTIKESHKRVAQVYQDYIRLSPLPACKQLNDGGHWRSLHVRSNEAGDIMAFVVVQPKGYKNEEISKEQKALKNYFYEHLPNITLFQQQCMYLRCTNIEAPFILLYGKVYFMESLKGYRFKISPHSYFPINKWGAEILYDTVISTAKLNINTTVLDICSGSGIASIIVSKFVENVYGMDNIQIAYNNAVQNAEINNIPNVRFLFGVVYKRLKVLLETLNSASDMVAILNSGDSRPGLDVIKTIRNYLQISRLVYISGKYENAHAMNNFHALCSNTTSIFPPFRLTKVIPVDILPQTVHIELVLLFER